MAEESILLQHPSKNRGALPRPADARNDHDVTNQICTVDSDAVQTEITRIFLGLYPGANPKFMAITFSDQANMYRGKYPGYQACDTAYHDLQHVLEVTLAMARLMDGYEQSRKKGPSFGPVLFQVGIILALLHDMGYVREQGDMVARNGAEYTLKHVSRGATFLKHYLPAIGLGEHAEAAAKLIHFTGFEQAVADIDVQEPLLRLLGSLLGTADIIAQMADRCYLEKCRDRLYPEFVRGGIAIRETPQGADIVYRSGSDLVAKTPLFFKHAVSRLNTELNGVYRYAAKHFGGANPYMRSAMQNVMFAKQLGAAGARKLRRSPPETTHFAATAASSAAPSNVKPITLQKAS